MLKRFMFLLVLALPSAALAHDDSSFDVAFNDCTEYVGFGPVDMAAARALVPQGFTVTDLGGTAGVVVRAASCGSIAVNGGPGIPAMVSHVGVNIVSPDGTGDINNYTVVYATNHPRLADRLRNAGLPAVYNPLITAEDPAMLPDEVYVSVFGARLPAYSITGTVNGPQFPAIPFVANWWYANRRSTVKMSTDIPSIAFGLAALEFRTSSGSVLGQLISGNTFTNFPYYNVRGEYAFGLMSVTTR
ncbi:MAG: hypothetical protein AB7H96_16930 [Vicinamibacterales bacterium]